MLKIGNEKAYNVQEAAELLKITPVTVRTYIKAGKIKAQKVGTRYHIAESNLQEFIKGGSGNYGKL